MSGRLLADGAPLAGDVIVVVDESAPDSRGGVTYVLASAAFVDPAAVRARLAHLLPGDRETAFHWAREGPRARARMIELIIESGVVAVGFVRVVGRRAQRTTRAD